MYTVTMSDKMIAELSKVRECPICYQNIDKNFNRAILKCRHVYHTSCIAKWVREQGNNNITCPECREILLLGVRQYEPELDYRSINNVLTTYQLLQQQNRMFGDMEEHLSNIYNSVCIFRTHDIIILLGITMIFIALLKEY